MHDKELTALHAEICNELTKAGLERGVDYLRPHKDDLRVLGDYIFEQLAFPDLMTICGKEYGPGDGLLLEVDDYRTSVVSISVSQVVDRTPTGYFDRHDCERLFVLTLRDDATTVTQFGEDFSYEPRLTHTVGQVMLALRIAHDKARSMLFAVNAARGKDLTPRFEDVDAHLASALEPWA